MKLCPTPVKTLCPQLVRTRAEHDKRGKQGSDAMSSSILLRDLEMPPSPLEAMNRAALLHLRRPVHFWGYKGYNYFEAALHNS